MGVVRPDHQKAAGEKHQLVGAISVIGVEVVFRLAVKLPQAAGGGNFHPFGACQHQVNIQKFFMGFEKALGIRDGVVVKWYQTCRMMSTRSGQGWDKNSGVIRRRASSRLG